MAIMMKMEWAGVTKAQYDEVAKLVHFEHDRPAGGLFHAAVVDDHGLQVVDVWESAEAFGRFAETKLKPATAKVGMTGEPKVTILPVHNVFAMGYTAKH